MPGMWVIFQYMLIIGMVWMFIDPHPKFIMLNPNPSSDSTRRWGLWEVNRSLSSVFLKGVSARTKEAPWLFFLTQENTEGNLQSVIRKLAPARARPCWCQDLGLPNLQNWEKKINSCCLWATWLCYFVTAAWMDQKCYQHELTKLLFSLLLLHHFSNKVFSISSSTHRPKNALNG